MKPFRLFLFSAICAACAFMAGGCTEKVEENVNKTALQTAISAAETLLDEAEVGTNPGQYPQEAVTAFESAIADAKSVNDNASATQEEVDNAVKALETAEDTFKAAVIPVEDVDKSSLEEAVGAANTLVESAVAGDEEGQYPQEAIDAFKAAIEAAQEVLDNAGATQSDVDAAFETLETARQTFVDSVNKAADRTALKTALDEANTLVSGAVAGDAEGQYPQEAIDAFKAAIAAAQTVYDNTDAKQSDIDKAVEDLAAARSTFEDAQVKSALALYLPFSGNANDNSGNNHTVTLKGGESGQPQPALTSDRLGAPDQAYAFDGGFMSIPYDKSFNAPEMSVMYWMCQYELSATDMATISLGWWDCWMGKTIGGAEQNEIAFQAIVPVQSGVMIETGRWYHVAISRSSTSLDIYVDGELKNTQEATGPMPEYTTQPLRIGALSENAGSYYPFIGSLDEIRVYSKALSADEIKAVYEQERP